MKKILIVQPLVFLAFFFALSSVIEATEVKIGFINMQKAVASTKEWNKEFTTFKNDFQKEKNVIAEKEKGIRKQLEELNKQGFVLSPELKRQKEESFAKDRREFERYVQDRNDEFNKKEKEIGDKLLQKMIKIVQAIGKEKKYTMILEQGAVFYSSAEDDLTDVATKAYDKANP